MNEILGVIRRCVERNVTELALAHTEPSVDESTLGTGRLVAWQSQSHASTSFSSQIGALIRWSSESGFSYQESEELVNLVIWYEKKMKSLQHHHRKT